MPRINIVPLSVNRAFQGRRFKTKMYKTFEDTCLTLMPKRKLPPKPYFIRYKFGFSSKLADLGNPEKLVTDILCTKYHFNDRDIFKMVLEKEIVPKGKEFIEYDIFTYKP